ncbi:MAG: hypothetical protein H6Q67_2225 [Firmicutes bacterium]|nr:hypothetical protein [Bacillota bacterium]
MVFLCLFRELDYTLSINANCEDHHCDQVGSVCLSRPYTPQMPEPEKARDRWHKREKTNFRLEGYVTYR